MTRAASRKIGYTWLENSRHIHRLDACPCLTWCLAVDYAARLLEPKTRRGPSTSLYGAPVYLSKPIAVVAGGVVGQDASGGQRVALSMGCGGAPQAHGPQVHGLPRPAKQSLSLQLVQPTVGGWGGGTSTGIDRGTG
jgi:hypothetical protein